MSKHLQANPWHQNWLSTNVKYWKMIFVNPHTISRPLWIFHPHFLPASRPCGFQLFLCSSDILSIDVEKYGEFEHTRCINWWKISISLHLKAGSKVPQILLHSFLIEWPDNPPFGWKMQFQLFRLHFHNLISSLSAQVWQKAWVSGRWCNLRVVI